ncbi:MAG: phage/plasmid primase, P4 family [Candidatus Hadarchaeales archaeon]
MLGGSQVLVNDKWQCLLCGEEFELERGRYPKNCPNPNCRKGGHFKPLSGPYTYFEGRKFVSKLLAEKIMEHHRFATVMDTDEIFYYNNGCYHRHGEAVIREIAQRELDVLCKTAYVNETVDYIRRATYVPRDRFERPLEEICLRNGILNIYTGEFQPHTPDKFFINMIPVDYDPNADCPEIKQFFREVLNEEDIPVIEELFGYCLIRSYPIHKAVLFVGSGSNGKSTCINLLKTFLGKENVSAHPLQELEENKFAKADLYGKLANLHPDLPRKAMLQTGTFKALTGGDPISAEHKFKGPFVFTNYAKLIFAANRVPEAYDESDAFFRRWIIINFPNKFEGKNRDPKKLEKLTTPRELSGLLNLALAGLKRLLERGEFSYSKTTEEIREEYIRMSNPVKAFVMDMLEVAPNEWVAKRELYSVFCAYCREKNYPIVAENTFHQRLQRLVRVSDYRPIVEGGKRVTAWLGIRLAVREEEEIPPPPKSVQKTLDKEIGYHPLAEALRKLKNAVEDMKRASAKDVGGVKDVKASFHLNSKNNSTSPDSPDIPEESESLEFKGGKNVDMADMTDKLASLDNLQRRLFERFGFDRPFGPKDYKDMFTGEELIQLPKLFEVMLQRGVLVVTPQGFMFVRKG